MKTLIKNTKIILENRILYSHQVVIENKMIKEIVSNEKIINDCDLVIDGNGEYLSSGFIDIHNHGNSGYDTMDAIEDALISMSKFHINNGVTSFLATTMTNPTEKIKDALKNVANYIEHQSSESSRLLGVYLEGPYINIEKKGAQPGKDIKNPNIEELKEFIKVSNNNIKVALVAPELDGAKEMIQYLKENGVRTSIGHSSSNYEDANNAIELGATISCHLYNGMRQFTHRETGIVGACLTNNKLRTEIIADGIHVDKTAIEIAKLCKGANNIILISDAMRATGLADGIYELGGQIVISENGSARLEDGTLAGSTLNLNVAVRNMIMKFNTSIVDAVKMATINPARAIGVDGEIGSIEIGKTADIIIFDDNININHIIKDGILLK